LRLVPAPSPFSFFLVDTTDACWPLPAFQKHLATEGTPLCSSPFVIDYRPVFFVCFLMSRQTATWIPSPGLRAPCRLHSASFRLRVFLVPDVVSPFISSIMTPPFVTFLYSSFRADRGLFWGVALRFVFAATYSARRFVRSLYSHSETSFSPQLDFTDFCCIPFEAVPSPPPHAETFF